MLVLIILDLFIAVGLVSAKCYEPATAHPLPEYAVDDAVLKSAFGLVNRALATAIAAPEFADISFSIEVTSSKESLWSQHHTAFQRNLSRPDIPEVNGDALYRIASISKSFTVLGILYQHAAGNLSLDSSIDTYIGELQGEQDGSLPWKDISLRSLASQLSGIPRECMLPFNRCHTFQDLLESLKSKAPLFAPNQKSTYSNVAFELLGVALAKVTNQTYESYISDAIFKPLGMTKSRFSTPPDSAGVIPLEPQYWDVDEGIQNPTGGIYSSSTDLSKYLRYVLTHYNGITSALNWIHPVSPAEGLQSFYGIPWEIFRTDKILLNSRRPVQFTTKSGGLPGYTSIIMTVPEYDLGITILVAGDNTRGGEFFSKAREIVTVEIIRAAEAIAIRQLQERYTGTYVAEDDLNSTLTLVADHRGLVVGEFISNGTDVLKFSEQLEDGPFFKQLLPTLLYSDEKNQRGERWRMISTHERTDGDHDVWDNFCITNIDGPMYAGVPVNEMVFWEGKKHSIQVVELPGFKVKLSRQEDDNNVEVEHGQQEPLEL